MAISPDDVKSIAHLARLGVDDSQLSAYATEISNVLDLAEQMSAVDTADVEPMAHPLHATQRLRADVVSEINERAALQKGAPATDKGLFLVPKVID